MFTDVELICRKCNRKFWLTAAEQAHCRKERLTPPSRCFPCRGNGALVSTRLPKRVEKELTSHLIGRREAVVADLGQLLTAAFAPIEARKRTWLEWIAGADVQTRQLQEKWAATGHANSFVQQRTVLLQNLKAMVLAMGDLEHVELDAQLRLLQGRIALQRLEAEQLKLEAERLKLEEEIAQRQALKEGRIETLQLEEVNRQAKLLAQLQPAAPEPKKQSQVKQAISEHRNQFRAKATAKQLVLSDFLHELQKVYRANVEDSEKAARIRAVLEAYKQEPEALPRPIRDFLERVEGAEDASRA